MKTTGAIINYCKYHRSRLLLVQPPLHLYSFFFHASQADWLLLIDSMSSVDHCVLAVWVKRCFTFFLVSGFFFFICQHLVIAFTTLACHCTFALGLKIFRHFYLTSARHIPNTPTTPHTCYISHHLPAYHRPYSHIPFKEAACCRNCFFQIPC